VKYVIFGFLGGLVGVAVTWLAMPGTTLIDDAWKYIWLGLGVGGAAGTLAATGIRRRFGGETRGEDQR
jgi:hypothetical protein